MDLTTYRNSSREQDRIGKLIAVVPTAVGSVLDAGARDGYISKRLADKGHTVTALDLEQPQVHDDNVRCVQGDITRLQFANESFDLALCAEVLEHLRPDALAAACNELQRVAKSHVLIGVPFDQDIRIARTTCRTCGAINPPWAHINTFTERRLSALFPAMEVEAVTFVGQHRNYTNPVSALLLNLAGNPYGTYDQDEPCTHCGNQLKPPPTRTLLQKVFTKVAVHINRVQSSLMPSKPTWIHVLFRKSQGKALAPKTTENPWRGIPLFTPLQTRQSTSDSAVRNE